MATIDTTGNYILTNSFTSSGRALAVSGPSSSLEMADAAKAPTSAEWFLTTTDMSLFYRLHTVAGGAGQALDVINDNGTSSINLHMADTGQYSGQYWRFDAWPAGGGYPLRLSNNFTGLDLHLDVFSDTLEPHLASGDYTGQHWALSPVPAGGASPTAPPVSTTPPAPVVTSPPAAVSQDGGGHGSGLSPGAIAGIAIGGVAALALLIGVIAFVSLRAARRKNNNPQVDGGAQAVQHYGPGNVGNVGPDSKAYDTGAISPPPVYDAQRYANPVTAAELGSGQSRLPVELPSSERGELPDRPY